jgi:hypothetical protein
MLHGLKPVLQMSDSRDYKLDISSIPKDGEAARADARPFLMVHFACCGVYQRIYRSAGGERYEGHCPKCARPVKFRVGEGGTDARAFVVE